MIIRERLDIRLHAAVRMLERRITIDDILTVLNGGETIESYPKDTPYPSQLTLGFVRRRAIHVVWAEASDTQRTIVITAYELDPEEWDREFRVRKKQR